MRARHDDVMRRQRRPALDGGLSQRHDRVIDVLVLAGDAAGARDDRLGIRHGPEDDDGARVDLAAGADGSDVADLGDEDRGRRRSRRDMRARPSCPVISVSTCD